MRPPFGTITIGPSAADGHPLGSRTRPPGRGTVTVQTEAQRIAILKRARKAERLRQAAAKGAIATGPATTEGEP